MLPGLKHWFVGRPFWKFTAREARIVCGLWLAVAFAWIAYRVNREETPAERMDRLAILVQQPLTPGWDVWVPTLNKWTHMGFETSEARRDKAWVGIDKLGKPPESLVPLLQQQMLATNRWPCGGLSALSEKLLGRMGTSIIPEMSKLARSSDSSDRVHAARVLGSLESAEPPALQSLAGLLGDPTFAVRNQALVGLRRHAAAIQFLEPQIAGQLADADPRLRLEKSVLWLELNPKSKAAVEHFLRIWQEDGLGQHWFYMEERAAIALAQCGENARPALGALDDMLTYYNPRVRCAAALAIWKISGTVDSFMPMLDDMLEHETDSSASGICEVLGTIGPSIRGKVPHLEAMARRDAGFGMSTPARRALKRIDPKLAASIEASAGVASNLP